MDGKIIFKIELNICDDDVIFDDDDEDFFEEILIIIIMEELNLKDVKKFGVGVWC